MKGWIFRFFTSFSAVMSLLAAVLQLLGIASLYELARSAVDAPRWLGFSAIALFAAVLVLVVIQLGRVASTLLKPRRPFDITDEAFHFRLSGTTCVHTSRFTVRSKVAGNWAFPYRYYWSGGTKPTIEVISPKGATFLETGREYHWTTGQVVFPANFSATEAVVEIRSTSADTDFQNFVSRCTQERIETLTLEVTSDADLADVAQLILHTPHDAATKGVVPFDKPAQAAKNHSWVIKNPVVGKQYMLAWN